MMATATILKCCPLGKLISMNGGFVNCEESNSTDFWSWNHTFHHHNLTQLANIHSSDVDIVIGQPFDDKSCVTMPLDPNFEVYYLLKDGTLHHQEYGVTDLYCVDEIVGFGGVVQDIVLMCHITQSDDQNPEAICFHDDLFRTIFTCCGVVSLTCLVVTFIIYLSLPKLKNLKGNIIVSNVVSTFLFIVYILTAYNMGKAHRMFCVVIGYVGYYCMVTMFVWISILCYDIFRTFFNTGAIRSRSKKSMFLRYSLVGWGLGGVLCIILLLLQNLTPPGSLSNPRIGHNQCFVDKSVRWIFVHIPITIVVLANFALFAVTSVSLKTANANTKLVRMSRRQLSAMNSSSSFGDDSVNKKRKQSKVNQDAKEYMILYLKLFILTGVLWIFEAVRGLVRDRPNCSAISASFKITAVINMLRGVIIFIIFVCKRSILNQIFTCKQNSTYSEQISMKTAASRNVSIVTMRSLSRPKDDDQYVGHQTGV